MTQAHDQANPDALLDHADDILEGRVALGVRGARTAAVLARCAFEAWLDAQSAPWADDQAMRPTTQSKLVVLSALRGIEFGERAKRVWHGLSRACHHHAYELQPSVTEVRRLVAEARQLARGGRSGR